VEVYRSGAIKIASLKDDSTQVVNGQRLKHYIFGDSYNEDVDVIEIVSLEEFIQDKLQVTYSKTNSAGTCRVRFRIGNSSSQRSFAKSSSFNIFAVFTKYEKS
jgi:hypothetical protein